MRKPSGRHRGTNKTLSFASVILLGINGIIGSGIFLLPGTLYCFGWTQYNVNCTELRYARL